MRSARELGISTVAIYSEADRAAPHTRYADEAVCVGEAASSQSYLNAANILELCKALNVDAIHPGYGFLSENADFARKVHEEGLVFIGPSPESIRLMGDKLASKQAVSRYNIPLVPGTDQEIKDLSEAKIIAGNIGYPVLIKASAGGGGKGMRIARSEKELDDEINTAINEATSAFGNGAVFMEKYIESNKHIEVQVLGDQKGNIIHLFERECSIQRRHQKLIEEAPSISIDVETRNEIAKTAVEVARACHYYGAGTVEFIYADGMFYFLEMNTRLQVEHPVTELITGVDLVKEQIAIAEGKAISLIQENVHIKGHSIEVRVYAEDPDRNFLPDIGHLTTYIRPSGVGVRIDDGYDEGMKVPIYYDPMLAKLITYGETRDEARQRLIRAIDEYQVNGIKTTLPFCKFVVDHPVFRDGSFDTSFIESYLDDYIKSKGQPGDRSVAALMGVVLSEQEGKRAHESHAAPNGSSNWRNRLKEWQQ